MLTLGRCCGMRQTQQDGLEQTGSDLAAPNGLLGYRKSRAAAEAANERGRGNVSSNQKELPFLDQPITNQRMQLYLSMYSRYTHTHIHLHAKICAHTRTYAVCLCVKKTNKLLKKSRKVQNFGFIYIYKYHFENTALGQF